MIKYDKEIKLTAGDYSSYVCVHYPTIVDIKDSPGSSVLVCGPASLDKLWVTGTVRDTIIKEALQEAAKEIPVAPNPQFSESFLLKLVAISNNSNLAKELT